MSIIKSHKLGIYRLILITSVLTNLLLLDSNNKLNNLYDNTVKEIEKSVNF